MGRKNQVRTGLRVVHDSLFVSEGRKGKGGLTELMNLQDIALIGTLLPRFHDGIKLEYS
jgi:hypothetical protein